jgi:uncharacterized protein YecE (DUF72 family)
VEEERSRRLSANVLWVGCCGWAAARARYFKQFRTIELQSTFYQPSAVDLAEEWRRDAPEDFRFCLKAWQLITHGASSPTYRKLKAPLLEKSLEMSHFRVFRTRRRQSWPLPGLPESLGMERMKETAPTEAVGCIIAGAGRPKGLMVSLS